MKYGVGKAVAGIDRDTATSWLSQLVNAGILDSYKFGRDRLFVNDRFLEVLIRDELIELRQSSEPTLF
jgi:hypothetical protein